MPDTAVQGLKKADSIASCHAPPQPSVVTGLVAAAAPPPDSKPANEVRIADPAAAWPRRLRNARRSRFRVSSSARRSVSKAYCVSLSVMAFSFLFPSGAFFQVGLFPSRAFFQIGQRFLHAMLSGIRGRAGARVDQHHGEKTQEHQTGDGRRRRRDGGIDGDLNSLPQL